jgi:hypothetical protein
LINNIKIDSVLKFSLKTRKEENAGKPMHTKIL